MSRINLSQRIVIESGIYQRLKLTEIAKKIGMSVTAVSNEINLNRTPAKGSKPHGNDCRFANECEEKNLCCNFDCNRKCVWCFDFNCRELCNKYDNSPCSVLQKPPYVCNVCYQRRKCKCDRFYYMANQADAMSKKRYSKARKKTHADKDELKRIDSIVSPLIRKNYLNQKFHVEKPNEVWVSDITFITINKKGYYICVIIDLFARRVVGYRIGYNNSTQLTKSTFKNAYEARRPDDGLIFHTDNGTNYRSKRFVMYLKSLNVTQSFSRAYVPYDNSVMESFFSNLKREELYRKKYCSEKEFRTAVDSYIKFYNLERPHAANKYKTPAQKEAEYYSKQAKNSDI